MKTGWKTIAAAACLAMVSLGQTTVPSPMDQELGRLHAENEELRKEVASLKAKLASARTAAETQPAKNETTRKFTTMMDVLTNVPADLRPQAKADWYKFTESKFEKWVSDQMVGMIVDTSLQYSGGKTTRNFLRSGPENSWVKYPGPFAAKKFTYFGAEHQWTVRCPQMTFDDDGAKKWDAIKAGTLFKVKGTIKSVSIQKLNYSSNKLPSYSFSFELDNFEMTPPK
jgi:hypothetical protein